MSEKRDGRETGTRGCAICGKPVEPHHRPFCSRRCKEVDLNRWLSGSYVVPAVELDEDEVARLADLARGTLDPEPDEGAGGPT